MPRPTRPHPAAEPTRERILVAASMLFARRGYHGTSTRAIADAVGIRQPSMFHHFATKSEVMKELLDASLTPTKELSGRLVRGSEPPAERLALFLVEVDSAILRSRFNLVGLFTDDVLNDEDFTEWRRIAEAIRDDQREMIEQGVASGDFIGVQGSTAQLAVQGLTAAVMRLHRGSPPDDIETCVTEVVSLALRMLMRDQSRVVQVLEAARQRATGWAGASRAGATGRDRPASAVMAQPA